MKKRFLGLDANGTDGTDPDKMLAVYEVLDDEGLIWQIRVLNGLSGAQEDAAMVAEETVRGSATVVNKA